MNRTWKWVTGIALVLVIAAITVPRVFVVKFASKGREVEAEIARIKAIGEPVSAADLTGKPILDSENAALVYEKCYKYLPKSESSDNRTIADFIDPDKRAANPKLWTRAKTIVDCYAPALSLAEKAAAMPKCWFKVDWDDPLNAKLPHYGRLRVLGRLTAARALLDAKSGDTAGVVESVGLIIRIGDSLKDEPVLIGALVRCVIIHLAANALADASNYTSISEAEAHRMSEALGRVHLQGSIVTALWGERVQGIIVFDQIRDGNMPNIVGDKEASATVQRTYRSFPFSAVLDNDEAYYLGEMRYRIGRAGLPYRVLARQTQDVGPDAPRYALFSTLLLGPGRTTAARDRAIANLAGSQLLLGLLAYRDHFGSYPASLGELKTKLNWQLPEDPFSGKPFAYRRQGKGFLLYSIGDDLKDNGGIESKRGGPGDIVWRLDR